MADDDERGDEEQDEAPDQDDQSAEGDSGEGDSADDDSGNDDSDEGRTPSPSLSAKEMTVAAREALADLTGHEPEAATGLMWDGESWIVTVDVLELRRIPDTTDLLATYVVQLDDDGNLSGYKRTRRFQRSQAEEG